MSAQVPGVVAVAFLVEQDQQPALHLPKKQHPTAWFTALRYQCPLGLGHVTWGGGGGGPLKKRLKKNNTKINKN